MNKKTKIISHRLLDQNGEEPFYKPKLSPPQGQTPLHLNENIYGPPPACIESLVNLQPKELSLYPRGGSIKLSQKLAQMHGIDSASILLENGSSGVLKTIFSAFSNPQSPHPTSILLPDQGWAYNTSLARLNGCKAAYYSLKLDKEKMSYRFDTDELVEQIQADRPDLLLLVSPNAFTGNVLPEASLIKLLEACGDKTLAVVDQAYTEYSYLDDIVPSKIISDYQNVIFSRTLSKFYALANLRIGYALAHWEIIEHLKKYSPIFSVSGINQSLADKALDYPDYYKKIKEENYRVRKSFIERLQELKNFQAYQSESNFVLIKLSGMDATTVLNAVGRQGIIIGSTENYGMKNYLRITVGDEPTMKKLFGIFKKLDDAQAEL
jgi:histidinol-phosphate aminotransferase